MRLFSQSRALSLSLARSLSLALSVQATALQAAEAGVADAFAAVAATSVGTVTVDNFPPTHMPTHAPTPMHTITTDDALALRPSKTAAALAAVCGAFLGLSAL